MNDLPLLAALLELSEKLVSWLTPLWLLGVGVVLGLLSFLVVWAVAAVISRLGPIGRIGEDRGRAVRWSTVVTLVLGSIGIATVAVQQWDNLVGGDEGNTLTAVARLVSLSVPALLALWLGVFGFLMLVWRRTVQEMPQALIEGVLWPILVSATFLVGFGFMGFFIWSIIFNRVLWPATFLTVGPLSFYSFFPFLIIQLKLIFKEFKCHFDLRFYYLL